MVLLTVIIPTYNPDLSRLNQTLDGLKSQDLDQQFWELIIIDNNSSVDFGYKIDLSWHHAAKIVQEKKQGLTYARLKGFAEAKGDFIVMLDDDNVAAPNYLSQVKTIFEDNLQLGAIGGKSIPIFETDPLAWLKEFYGNLALRDLGDHILLEKWEQKYPPAAPLGAGMAIRKQALQSYIQKMKTAITVITDRKGNDLSSGGDNDIVLEIVKSGWLTGYFPSLIISHIIPKERLQPAYLSRLIHDTNKSWMMLLTSHGINPWKKISRWTLVPRKLKAWFNYRAWQNDPAYIRWKGACGTFDGLAAMYKDTN